MVTAVDKARFMRGEWPKPGAGAVVVDGSRNLCDLEFDGAVPRAGCSLPCQEASGS
jgi:hypothetical protein